MRQYFNRLMIAIIAAISVIGTANAQTPNITGNEFATQTVGKTVVGTEMMCLNSSNQAVPCQAAGALPIPVTATLQTSGYDAAPPVTPTIQNASYVSGNAVGALQTVAMFRTVAQPSGILNGWFMGWNGTETTPITFYVFDTNPTASTCNDRSAFSLASADKSKLISIGPFTLTAAAPSVGTTSTFATASFSATSIKNQDSTPSINLYVCAVAGGTFTPAVGDLFYKPAIAQD